MPSISKLRELAFRRQNGHCFYCCQPIWLGDASSLIKKWQLPQRKAKLLQATAEHLIAKSEGGKDTEGNIVAACVFCNRTRHVAKRPLGPSEYCARVRTRLLEGRWHGIMLSVPVFDSSTPPPREYGPLSPHLPDRQSCARPSACACSSSPIGAWPLPPA